MNLKVCCIKLSLAARVIAMVRLITSVLVLTQLFSDFFTDTDGTGSMSILLGLDIDEFSEGEAVWLKILFLFFALVYAVASSILIWGSIVEVNYYAFPWLVFEGISFGAQVATFVLICVKMAQKSPVDRWVLLFSVCNLFLSIYFWIVVFCAQRTWALQRREERENMSTTTLSSGNDTIHDEVYEQPQVATNKGLEITFDPPSLSSHPDKRIDIHFVD